MKLNRRIIVVMIGVLSLFLAMVTYLTYFSLTPSKKLEATQQYASRNITKEEKILRGKIYDRNGTVLAYSEKDENNNQKRIYPFGSLYAHTVGYHSISHGDDNLERTFNKYLMQPKGILELLEKGENEEDEYQKGANLNLTLDSGMTEYASQLMGSNKGSVVALNPRTGEVYCMYTNPSFDPNISALDANWDSMQSDDSAPLYSRSTKSTKPPGSTFKVVTATAALECGWGDYTTEDKGSTVIDGQTIYNASGAFGHIGMEKAIEVSSNVYFSEVAQKVGKENFKRIADAYYLTKPLPFDIDVATAQVENESENGPSILDKKTGLAASAYGQGEVLVTPLHMALVAATVANNGVMMKPYMVEKVSYDDGGTVYSADSEVLSNVMSATNAYTLSQYMTRCVHGSQGTGRSAQVSGITVAGKTGTAENSGPNHAWFICFAPAENPQIAMCVMKENAGSGGGSVCAPVARDLIRYALDNGIITQ